MGINVGHFVTEDNVGLYYNYWPADKADAPCVIYLHGLESHMGWFFNLAEYLNSKGMNVYAFDRRGSGLNRESCKNFSSKNLLGDISLFIELIKKDHPESKIYLVGLCLGGKIAVSFASAYQKRLDGLILISPSLKTKLKFSPMNILSILFKPNSMLKIPIEDRMFTSNERYLTHIAKDPMRLHNIPAGHLLEIARMDRNVKRAVSSVSIPVLLMLAGIDRIIDTDSVKRWFQKLKSKDKTIKVYDGLHHILTFEEKPDIVLEDVYRWIWSRSNA